ncbi:MAG: Daunorubicin/doxorubicin resistance ATP-binding protein DrrA [Pseudomonadota bacterium]
MPAISFQSVSKTYPAKNTGSQPFTALNKVSFDIAEGEFFGLLGPNGAGKTTLISILAGLSKATEGRVMVHGKDVQLDYAQTRRMLGVVPQELVFGVWSLKNWSLTLSSPFAKPCVFNRVISAFKKTMHGSMSCWTA